MIITRPEPGEYAQFYAGYVGKISDDNWSDQMQSSAEMLHAVLEPLTEKQWNFRYASEKWSIKQLVLHIIDAERIFAYRALRFARGDETPLAGFEEKDYAVTGRADDRTGGSLLTEFDTVRRATVSLFEHFPDEVWKRNGLANGSPMSVRGVAYVILGHHLHHLAVLKERYLEALG